MTSQVSKVVASELSIGDIICGVNDTEWSTHYELTRKNNPIGSYCQYHVKRVHPVADDELTWSPPVTSVIWVKEKLFQYDPRQAGDTDEDI